MDKLPKEVVEIILSSPQLSFENILNVGATCKHFYHLVRDSRYIWKKKYQERYPQCLKYLDTHFNDWYSEILYIHDLRNRTHQLLSTMSPRFYKQTQLSEIDLVEWVHLMNESLNAYNYIVMDLISILKDTTPIKSIKVVPIDTPGNKTFQYYAIRALRFIRQQYLKKLWQNFEKLPLREQILEKGATFLAQWCQPMSTFEWEDIAEQLDGLTNEVIMEVQIQYPQHPLLKVSEEVLLNWKLYNLDANQWNVIQCQQLMKCLIFTLFTRNKFTGNTTAYYMPENSYINEVLSRKQGLPITLAVIFESIGRRIGLKCEPYAFPSHFLLRFTEGREEENNAETYYIDVFNNGNIIRRGGCPRNTGSSNLNPHQNLKIATTKQVVERMANNLDYAYRQLVHPTINLTALRSALELIHVINPHDVATIVGLARFYMLHGIDIKPLEEFLMSGQFNSPFPDQGVRILNMLRDYDLHRRHNFSEPITKFVHKTRPKNLKYAVGMIMLHVGLNSNCVIYDWDPICTATLDWQKQTGVQNLRYGRDQPFYKIFVEDGFQCYAPQESLTPAEPYEIHILEEIGKHFSHYFQTHYVPNAEKEREYADDAEVRHMFHQQMQFGY